MNKEKFLMELREYLSILENQEQDDILAEYAQHIDMKMQKGLSEEEAIRDFGPMQELASEILEAYHVKPEFRRKSGVLKLPVPVRSGHSSDDRAPLPRRGFEWIREKTAGVMRRIGRSFWWLGSKCRNAVVWVRNLFTGRKGRGTADTKEGELYMEEMATDRGADKDTDGVKKTGGFWKTLGRGIATMWRGLAAFCIFWLKFMWNAGWLLFSLFCACMAMIILMGVGAIPIFLFQGYPFIGFFLICLGGLLCFGTLSWGAFSMMIRKKKEDIAVEADRDNGEVQYEQTA